MLQFDSIVIKYSLRTLKINVKLFDNEAASACQLTNAFVKKKKKSNE